MKLGIIGGTALEVLELEDRTTLARETAWGMPSGPIHRGQLGAAEIYFINRHGDDHSIPPHAINYRANIAALKDLQVDTVVAVSAVGGITTRMTAGGFVLPDQIIDYTWGREHTYSVGGGTSLQHVDFSAPYCSETRGHLLAAASACDVEIIDGATHGVTQGPRLESAAEIRRMERDGCDIVGMTGMPEAGLARELSLPYASLALVVNPAAGKSDCEITMGDITRVMQLATPALLAIFRQFCR